MDTDKVNLAVIIKNPSNDEEFLLVKQTQPAEFNDPEYDSYQDSDLWDLPSIQLTPLGSPLSQHISVEAGDSSLSEKLGSLNQFDLKLALDQTLNQVGFGTASEVKWKFLKYVEEPEFGPGIPVKTMYLVGTLGPRDGKLKGSALLDITSGGNMSDYFHTTYKFMELSPHVLIPMHGRVNMWPKHMLCGYLKNRRNGESTILEAVESGGKTLFDIFAYRYVDVDRSLWLPATSNVRLHVDHLAQQDKLPKEFSLQKFQSTCKLHFLSQWAWAYLCNTVSSKTCRLPTAKFLVAGAVATLALVYFVREVLSSKKIVW